MRSLVGFFTALALIMLSAQCGLAALEPGVAVERCQQKGKGFFYVQNTKPLSSNGCGSAGMRISTGDDVDFTPCCDLHDACYSICGVAKDSCETRFKKCLDSICRSSKDQQQCKGSASMFSMGATMMGSGAYEAAQEAHCDCVHLPVGDSAAVESSLLAPYLAHGERIYSSQEQQGKGKLDSFRERLREKLKDIDSAVAESASARQKRSKALGSLLLTVVQKYPSSILHEEGHPALEDGKKRRGVGSGRDEL